MSVENNLVIKTYKVREDTALKIEEVAKELDVSQAAVVRYILNEYFDKPKTYGMGFGNPHKNLPTT